MVFNARRLAFAAAFLLLLSLLFSTACQSSGTRARRRLLIYTPHGQDMLRDFINRYKQAEPDVDVQFQDMGAQEVLARLRVERNRPQADLWWGAAHTTYQTAAEENLLAPYRPSWADKVPESSRDPQDRWYGTYETPEVIVYNTELVRAEDAPRDWDEVLDPKWRDKVLIRNPIPSDSMRAIFGAMIWRFSQGSNSPQAGYDWLRRLDANVHEYTADPTLLMQKLERGEGVISLWNMPDIWLYRDKKNFHLAYVIPRSGTPVITDGIAVIRNSPNQEEARRFYEFVTTPESLSYAARTYYRIPARTDLDRSQLPPWMNEPFTRMPLDWDLLRREGGEWLRYWDTEIRGRNRN
ncbi:MAG TPA: extracellular solute-binding protein [Pyrinomonadaceae bacterium]|jgi:iron(III) transport system substrate-binding protein